MQVCISQVYLVYSLYSLDQPTRKSYEYFKSFREFMHICGNRQPKKKKIKMFVSRASVRSYPWGV